MNIRALAITALFAFTFLGTARAQGVTNDEQQQVQTQPAKPAANAVMGPQADRTFNSGSTNQAVPMSSAPRSNDGCVGPVSFCNIFFGS
ncbi:hypothetical protein [Paraburkholderia largidicola]|uniref:Uncharacterized protein n=1 Tax=Paraburkholderia largidicola TaxID=3014751 RepID=A0A7I8C3I6_9BURK|nr:hypothetical protein [Paraburkholderia sp. PGU16]BCF95089.1 hypothetical protein PPGU16_81560 [Paraburkholderia sp. PGU16]